MQVRIGDWTEPYKPQKGVGNRETLQVLSWDGL
jgi:hypothetical protein